MQNKGLFQLWLKFDELTVGYVHYRIDESEFCDGYPPVIDVWEVEVRPGYRGQGISRKLAETVKNHHGAERIISVGGFTPDGAKFFSRYCEHSFGASDPHICDQSSFVDNWDEQRILPPRP